MTIKETTHSPGPWETDKRFDGRTQIVREDGSVIAWMNESDDTDGNARIMAAAPRMFTALKAIAAMRSGNGAEIAALCTAIASITLAEGGIEEIIDG